jgi:hypothetical protein
MYLHVMEGGACVRVLAEQGREVLVEILAVLLQLAHRRLGLRARCQ